MEVESQVFDPILHGHVNGTGGTQGWDVVGFGGQHDAEHIDVSPRSLLACGFGRGAKACGGDAQRSEQALLDFFFPGMVPDLFEYVPEHHVAQVRVSELTDGFGIPGLLSQPVQDGAPLIDDGFVGIVESVPRWVGHGAADMLHQLVDRGIRPGGIRDLGIVRKDLAELGVPSQLAFVD